MVWHQNQAITLCTEKLLRYINTYKALRGCVNLRSHTHPRSPSLYCHQFMCLPLLPASTVYCFQCLFMVSLLSIKIRRTDKNKETKIWEKRKAVGKRGVGDNICTTGFRDPKKLLMSWKECHLKGSRLPELPLAVLSKGMLHAQSRGRWKWTSIIQFLWSISIF